MRHDVAYIGYHVTTQIGIPALLFFATWRENLSRKDATNAKEDKRQKAAEPKFRQPLLANISRVRVVRRVGLRSNRSDLVSSRTLRKRTCPKTKGSTQIRERK
jgi:hypothetical protein